MSMQPEGFPSLACFLLFWEEKFFPDFLPPCPPRDFSMCPIGQIWVTRPSLARGEAEKQFAFLAFTVGQARKKGSGEEQPNKSISHSALSALHELGLHRSDV